MLFSDIVCIGHLRLLSLVVLLISWSLVALSKLVGVVITHGIASTSQLGVTMGKSTVGFVSAHTYEITALTIQIKK
jgi:hypothetical protein